MTLTVTTDNKGVLPKLLVGHLSPVSSGVYVKLADKPAVLMTTSDFLTAVSKKVNDVRSHELVTFNMDDAQQIVLRSGANKPIEIDGRAASGESLRRSIMPRTPTRVAIVSPSAAGLPIASARMGSLRSVRSDSPWVSSRRVTP